MRYKNKTNVPDKIIDAVVKAVAPIQLRRVKISVYNHRARHRTFGFFRTTTNSISIHLPNNDLAAMFLGPECGSYECPVFKTRIEALVMMMAHETKHVEQYKRDLSRNLNPEKLYKLAPHVYESEAEKYSGKMLRLFRQGKILPRLRNWSSTCQHGNQSAGL
jgi:hypothetical protein